jgi:hypothetical protein
MRLRRDWCFTACLRGRLGRVTHRRFRSIGQSVRSDLLLGLVGEVLDAVMAEQDYLVGQIVDCVEQAGISDNTLIVFSSDNAALDQGVANARIGETRVFLL